MSTNGVSSGPPTFVLGVGAQKAGTTWFYRYLQESPEFAAGYRKEYHVFDTLDLESESWSRNRIITLAETALADLREGRPADAAVLHRMSMYGNPAYYYDYFTALLSREPGRHVTADMTPAYALLSVERLREIRQEFAARGVRAVAVYLMRDPVDRIWSQLRMQHQRKGAPGDRSAEERVLEQHAEPQYAARSKYHRTIEVLDEAFGDDVHYEFYERLFTPEAVAALCRAIGISMHPPALERRSNEAPAEADLPESTQRTVAAHLAEVYRRVGERFPEVDLRALWPSARFVP
ncbi:MAG TPA: sulfotransferase [Nocardioides sp.]|nr:sulfotransferase [Nocardioides sp.]